MSDRRSACEQLLKSLEWHIETVCSCPDRPECCAAQLALLDAFATRMQAEALREAAEDWIGDYEFHISVGAVDPVPAAKWLRARASQVGAVVTREGRQEETKD